MQIRAIDLLILCAQSLEAKEQEHSEKCIKMLGEYSLATMPGRADELTIAQ